MDESTTPKPRKRSSKEGFTRAEQEAMKERAKELKAARSRSAKNADGEGEVLAKIAAMPDADRAIAERLHAIIRASAPDLVPRTWYGMPAYSNKEGKVVCFFRAAQMFKERYMTLGFNQEANLDEGTMWATAFAITNLTAEDEAKIGDLVKKSVS